MVGDRGRVKGGGRAAQHASAHHGAPPILSPQVGDRGREQGGGRAAQHASAHHGAPRSSPHRWVTAAESKEEVDVRMDELINQIHYCPHERIVLVRDCH